MIQIIELAVSSLHDKMPFRKLHRTSVLFDMMTSSNGNIFRVTGHLCGEFTGPRLNSPHRGQWRGALMFSVTCVWINGWVNNREAGDLRRNRAHYDVTVMLTILYTLVALRAARYLLCVSRTIWRSSGVRPLTASGPITSITSNTATGGKDISMGHKDKLDWICCCCCCLWWWW